MSQPTRVALLTLAVLTCLIAPTAAYADRWASSDNEGDVEGWHYDPEPAPCGTRTDLDASANTNQDITKLVVSHRRREVKVVVRFQDLVRDLEQHIAVHLRSGKRGWLFDVNRFRDFDTDVFQVSAFLARAAVIPGEEDDGCGEAVRITPTSCHVRPHVDLEANVLRANLSRSCLRNPRWVRVGVRATDNVKTEDGLVVYSDVWGADGTVSSWLPPLGERVAAPPGVKVSAGRR